MDDLFDFCVRFIVILRGLTDIFSLVVLIVCGVISLVMFIKALRKGKNGK